MLGNRHVIFFNVSCPSEFVNLKVHSYIEDLPCCKQKPWTQEIWKSYLHFLRECPTSNVIFASITTSNIYRKCIENKRVLFGKSSPLKRWQTKLSVKMKTKFNYVIRWALSMHLSLFSYFPTQPSALHRKEILWDTFVLNSEYSRNIIVLRMYNVHRYRWGSWFQIQYRT